MTSKTDSEDSEQADRDKDSSNPSENDPLQVGVDYYFENGLMVFTSHFLLKRGYCCESGCRHCPYGFERDGSKN